MSASRYEQKALVAPSAGGFKFILKMFLVHEETLPPVEKAIKHADPVSFWTNYETAMDETFLKKLIACTFELAGGINHDKEIAFIKNVTCRNILI